MSWGGLAPGTPIKEQREILYQPKKIDRTKFKPEILRRTSRILSRGGGGGGGGERPNNSNSPKAGLFLAPLRPETFGFVRSMGLFEVWVCSTPPILGSRASIR